MSETKPTDDERSEETPRPKEPATAKTNGEGEGHARTNGAKTDAVAEPEGDATPEAEKDEAEKDEAEKDETAKVDPLLTPGNPLRWKRGLIAILGGGIPSLLLMAKNGQNAWGIPVGFLCICVCAFGVMDLLGTFDDKADGDVEVMTTGSVLLPSFAASVGLAVAFGLSLWMAQASVVPTWLACALVPTSFLALVAAVFRLGQRLGPWRTDELGLERPIWSRHGFWVVVVGALLYMPALGLFSLWDPWETHYGEVAREVLARDDWISLWWAQDGWFWSKPILNFWIQSLAMGTLGTHFQPDQMMIAANGTATAHAEWVVRTPNVLMTIGAMYVLYKGVAKVFGRRAGLLGAIVLATMPDWFFLAHQTMTDMPFVAAMTAAMGLLLYGLNTEEGALVRLYEVKVFGAKLRVSLWHLVFGAVLLCAIPQIFYLVTRNMDFVVFGNGPHGFHLHADEFKSGSAGNCGLPGNEACASHLPASIPKTDTWWHGAKAIRGASIVAFFALGEPALQGTGWAIVLGIVLYLNWGERRARRLVYIAAWLCAAIATMAKGPAGFGMPIICAFAYVATKKRWGELLRFEMVSGLLIILCVALPWYVAMYVRHGSPFTDRLIFHDMFNRAFSHVHDTNEGDDTGIRYYIWQLGYAAFPWTGLVPVGILWGFRRSDSAIGRVLGLSNEKSPAVGDASVLLVMWFLFSFALFTFMGTKFHHYIFPAVPPAAMLVGIVLDDMLGRYPIAKPGRLAMYLGGLTAAVALGTYGASKLWVGSIIGAKVAAPAAAPVLAGTIVAKEAVDMAKGNAISATAILLLVVAAGVFAVSFKAFQQKPDEEPAPAEGSAFQHEQLMLGAAGMAAAFVTLLVGRDLSNKPEGAEAAGAIRLLQLFTYNYKRPWPDTLDFSAILGGFTVVAAALGVALAVRSLRRHAVAALCGFALLWAVWGLDVYMIKLSPHWGQHEVIQAYYADRAGPQEELIAYQMNWKGENFYTGNHIPAFVSTGATFQTFLKKEREKGTKVMYFVTEHSRISGLKSEVGAKQVKEIPGPTDTSNFGKPEQPDPTKKPETNNYKELTDKALNNKFVLVRVEL